MNKLIMVLIFMFTAISGANGIERFEDDSNSANRVSWEQILNNKMNLQVLDSSMINPVGASLFNVCKYSNSEFQVIDSGTKCVEYKTREVSIPRSGGQTEIEKTCIRREEVGFQLISSMYNKCMKTAVVSDNKKSGKKRKVEYACVKSKMVQVPTVQKVDVYSIRKEEIYQFSKTYEVPACDELDGDLPESDLPKSKN